MKIANITKKQIAIMIMISACFSGCSGSQGPEGKKQIPVKVKEVTLQNISRTLDYVGDIKAQDEAEIYPKVSGKILEKLKEENSQVNKGDIIAFIDQDEVGFKFEKAPVESPLSGIVGRIYVDKGVSVDPKTPLGLVVDIDRVKISLDIPEKYFPEISLGQQASVTVDAYPDKTFTGEVSKISPVIDLSTRTAPVEIIINNAEHLLKPGMFGRLKLNIEEHKNVPVILKEAIIGKNSQQYIYVITDGTALKRPIKTGIREGAYFEITEGLKEGELVVIMGQQILSDGTKVLVEKEEGNN